MNTVVTVLRTKKNVALIIILLMASAIIGVYGVISYRFNEAGQSLAETSAVFDYQLHYSGPVENIYNDSAAISNMDALYKELSGNPDFSYYELSSQPLYLIEKEIPDKFLYGYEMGQDIGEKSIPTSSGSKKAEFVKCVQLSGNCFNAFSIRVEEGGRFTDADYILSGDEPIPLLLGAEYRPLFDIGDEFDLDFIQFQTSGKVVGFLEEGASVLSAYDMITLDRYIVMPSFNIEDLPKSTEEMTFFVRYHTQKLSGYIAKNKINLNNKLDDWNNQYSPIKLQASRYDYSVSVGNILLSNLTVTIYLKYFCLILTAILSIIYLLIFIRLLRSSEDLFKMLLVCGMSYRRLYISLFLCFMVQSTVIAILTDLVSGIAAGSIIPSLYTIYFILLAGAATYLSIRATLRPSALANYTSDNQ